MRFYKQHHRFYAGGDLHARTLYLHVLDDQGHTRFEKNQRRTVPVPEAFAKVKRICKQHAKARKFVSVEGTDLDFRGH